jgi:hypothetical protein
MVLPVTTVMKTTGNTHVFQVRNTMAADQSNYHGTTTMGQPEAATTLMD